MIWTNNIFALFGGHRKQISSANVHTEIISKRRDWLVGPIDFRVAAYDYEGDGSPDLKRLSLNQAHVLLFRFHPHKATLDNQQNTISVAR